MAELKKVNNGKSKNVITLKKTNPPSKKMVGVKSKPITLDKKPKSKDKRKKTKIINFILSFLMFLGICIMGVIIAFCVYIVITAPAFDTDKLYNKEATIFYDRYGTEIGRVGDQQREIKTYEELPEVLIDALVATEDSRFFQHNGFDVVRFIKASIGQAVGQDGAGGASTLTMQVAKNTFSKNADGTIEDEGIAGIIRKFHDIYVSVFLIERNYTKEEIIEFYVNSNFLGYNTYGVEQASQKYFGKSVADLTLTEAALMIGIFNAPSSYNPFASVELATKRRSTVLSLMEKHGYITSEQAEDANNIPVESLLAERNKASTNPYQAFIDTAAEEVQKNTGNDPYKVPMLVYTTMDPTQQQLMNDLNEGKLGYKFKTYRYNDYQDNIQIGIAVVSVEDGSLTSVNIGRNIDGSSGSRIWNRAVHTKTQPGSAAKPIFAYGPYIEYNNGNTGTMFYDVPYTYSNGQALKNADDKYNGPMTMRQALAKSRNIPAIQAFQAVDKEKIGEFAHNVGIQYEYRRNSEPDYNIYESYAIGGGLEVSPLDMAAAYATFARGGYYIKPYSYTKIVYRETDEIDNTNEKYEKVRAMSEETAYMITDMLMTATAQKVGGNVHVAGTEVATKTGTSTYDTARLKAVGVPLTASADNWVLSYSPDYVLSLWYGVDSLGPKQYTDNIAAAIERVKISAILSNKIFPTNSKFKRPTRVVSSKYELETNPAELPSEYTPANLISNELFKKGTEPSEVSNRFNKLKDPTNGDYDVNGSTVTLSWKEISTPSAINTSYLMDYFTDNFGKLANTYYEKRISYNNSNIGSVGYQVYLETDSGLQSLGYTQDSFFKYNLPTGYGKYKFVVKSSYSIFKANQSDGLKIEVDLGGNIPELPDDESGNSGTNKDKDKNTNTNKDKKPNNNNKLD